MKRWECEQPVDPDDKDLATLLHHHPVSTNISHRSNNLKSFLKGFQVAGKRSFSSPSSWLVPKIWPVSGGNSGSGASHPNQLKSQKMRLFRRRWWNIKRIARNLIFIIEEMFFGLIAGSTPVLVARLELNIQGAPGRSQDNFSFQVNWTAWHCQCLKLAMVLRFDWLFVTPSQFLAHWIWPEISSWQMQYNSNCELDQHSRVISSSKFCSK